MNRRSLLSGIAAAAAAGGIALFGDEIDAAIAARVGDEDVEMSDSGEGPDDKNSSLDPANIEARFIERFNAMREEQTLHQATRNRFLSEMGKEHAENMAEHGYVGHVQPDTGMTIEDRFRDRGLLPECELPADDGSGRYYTGAENAATAALGRVQHPGSDKTYHITNNSDVATFLLDSWMTSPGHRRVMTLPAVRQIGLGTAIRDDGRIFAALEFC
jgi:uncharacterized protein YkwD